jgi:hypothetical protein
MTVTTISQSAGRIHSAIATAARATGVDFGYLLGQAKLESGLNAQARAGSSSATGLYQFIDQSWLAVVKKHGATHGLGWAADAIGRTGSGRMTVADAGTRSAILALRNDPEVASLMAAEHASDNADALGATLGRCATGTDLYMAHFLGLGGAKQFLSKMASDPGARGAALFPAAARANRGVFYAPDGTPRTLQQIYDRFAAKLGGAAAVGGAAPAADYATQALALGDDATVVTGHGQSATDALGWAQSTLGALERRGAGALRPTPDTARLAYLMLAGLGG